MFGKDKDTYVAVPVSRPTFVLTPQGKVHRVDHFICGIPEGSYYVTDRGVFGRSDQMAKVFTSPLQRKEYDYLRQLAGTVRGGSFMEDFEGRCREYGVEVIE